MTNPQKSTIALANGEGKVKTTYTYDPFGTTTTEGTASTNPYQYTGRENDGDGLQYNRARYYSPANGRFIGQDPTGFEASGANLYPYTLGDPMDFTDPMGRSILGVVEEAGEWVWEHRTQIAEVTAAGACVFLSPVACLAVNGAALFINTQDNIESDCGSFGNFAEREALSAGEALIGGAPGYLIGGYTLKFGEGFLPETNVGKWLLNTPPAMAAVSMTDLEPGISSSAGVGGEAYEGGSGGGGAGGSSPGGAGGSGSTSGSAAASSGQGC